MNLPLTTVAIVCHNNKDTLRAAVQSALDQTYPVIEIILVDDCSDDGTEEVIAELLRETDSLRVLSTPENSGSAGAPRNLAIDSAHGEYICFLDGDDVIDRNAVYNYAENVIQYDVDIVAGHMIRRQVATGSEAGWHKWLFREARYLDRADEFPDLVYDSTSTNKAYRVEFLREKLLYFPEGVHFEDNQFSARAYAQASGIRIIPDAVYYWLVYPSEQRLTITSNWKSVQSYADRIEAFLVGYRAFGDSGQINIRDKLVEKTVKHDIWLFIDSAVKAKDYVTLVKLWAAATPVFDTLTTEILDNVPLRQRAKIATLVAGDIHAHREANLLSANPNEIQGTIEAGVWVPSAWSVADSLDPAVRAYLDVSRDATFEIAARSSAWRHDVIAVSLEQDSVSVTGNTLDKFDVFDKSRQIEVLCQISRVGGATTQPVAGTFLGWEGARGKWAVRLDHIEDQSWMRGTSWALQLVLKQGELVATGAMISQKKVQPQVFIPRHQGVLSIVRDQLSLLSGDGGELMLRRRSRSGLSGVPGKALSTLSRAKEASQNATLGRLPTNSQIRVASAIGRRLPIKKDLVLFESHMGKQYSDSPRAIYERMIRDYPDLNYIWAFQKPATGNSYMGKTVTRHSMDYVRALARAAVVVDNQGFPSYYRRRPGQFYFQTWHGIPMKTMGTDAAFKDPREIAKVKKSVANWSQTICPSDYYRERLLSAMTFKGPTIDCAIPRNDILANMRPLDDFDYRELGLRPGRRYVLWAPTFRESASVSTNGLNYFAELIDSLPSDVRILVRGHYLARLDIPQRLKQWVIDVSDVEDVSRLYRIADLLITDYSSVLFDYMLTGKPVVIFAPDYAEYVEKQRGLNFDLEIESPGPFATDSASLSSAVLGELQATRRSDRYASFVKKFCGDNPGTASAQVSELIMNRVRNA
ncbi:bifunctional glycosyltransferase/CDP-glycerol:glycerophosphate glycerophosphotransferase [Brevibacterium aurantiacum]|uniref:Glycosyltransferase 2-like domain-containing protein n=1 Tax=Brevibacterium aurantiacum TaxID=273384 RepID=A0A2A3Z1G5_BREAU|nr:CDP-glycerol glycerophosphotransferase family protein [Brevibacterium aurantiacum]PCC45882.1 hypothetical protein CIK64_12655 [Brevibacterium aurantiacum]